MPALGVDRRAALDELRDILWEWDPLGFASERDLLAHEYDHLAERVLRALEEDADTGVLASNLSAWLAQTHRDTATATTRRWTSREAAARIDTWWRAFKNRPPGPRRLPVWGSPLMAGLLAAWLIGLAASWAISSQEDLVGNASGLDLVFCVLVSNVGALAFALLPAAALVGAPDLAGRNPSLLAGTALMALAHVVPGLGRGMPTNLSLHPIGYPDPAYFVVQFALSLLGLGLLLTGAVLATLGLRVAGARPTRWLLPVGVISGVVTLVMSIPPFIGYGIDYINAVMGNAPSLLWSIAYSWASLLTPAIVLAHLLTGAKQRLPPNAAWVAGSVGFALWIIWIAAAPLTISIGQAIPDWSGPLSAGVIALGATWRLAIAAAFVVGLGGGVTAPWLTAAWAKVAEWRSQPAPSA